jgi:anti-sigma factor RsiW
MDCQELVRVLSEYIDGELDARMRRSVERHAKDCICCGQLIATFRATLVSFRKSRVMRAHAQTLHYRLRKRLIVYAKNKRQ